MLGGAAACCLLARDPLAEDIRAARAAEAAGAVEGAAVEEAHAYEEYGNGGTMLCANQSGRACEQPALWMQGLYPG